MRRGPSSALFATNFFGYRLKRIATLFSLLVDWPSPPATLFSSGRSNNRGKFLQTVLLRPAAALPSLAHPSRRSACGWLYTTLAWA